MYLTTNSNGHNCFFMCSMYIKFWHIVCICIGYIVLKDEHNLINGYVKINGFVTLPVSGSFNQDFPNALHIPKTHFNGYSCLFIC